MRRRPPLPPLWSAIRTGPAAILRRSHRTSGVAVRSRPPLPPLRAAIRTGPVATLRRSRRTSGVAVRGRPPLPPLWAAIRTGPVATLRRSRRTSGVAVRGRPPLPPLWAAIRTGPVATLRRSHRASGVAVRGRPPLPPLWAAIRTGPVATLRRSHRTSGVAVRGRPPLPPLWSAIRTGPVATLRRSHRTSGVAVRGRPPLPPLWAAIRTGPVATLRRSHRTSGVAVRRRPSGWSVRSGAAGALWRTTTCSAGRAKPGRTIGRRGVRCWISPPLAFAGPACTGAGRRLPRLPPAIRFILVTGVTPRLRPPRTGRISLRPAAGQRTISAALSAASVDRRAVAAGLARWLARPFLAALPVPGLAPARRPARGTVAPARFPARIVIPWDSRTGPAPAPACGGSAFRGGAVSGGRVYVCGSTRFVCWHCGALNRVRS